MSAPLRLTVRERLIARAIVGQARRAQRRNPWSIEAVEGRGRARRRLVQALRSLGRDSRAEAVERCEALRVALAEIDGEWQPLVAESGVPVQQIDYCGHRLCPVCAGSLSRRMRRRLIERVAQAGALDATHREAAEQLAEVTARVSQLTELRAWHAEQREQYAAWLPPSESVVGHQLQRDWCGPALARAERDEAQAARRLRRSEVTAGAAAQLAEAEEAHRRALAAVRRWSPPPCPPAIWHSREQQRHAAWCRRAVLGEAGAAARAEALVATARRRARDRWQRQAARQWAATIDGVIKAAKKLARASRLAARCRVSRPGEWAFLTLAPPESHWQSSDLKGRLAEMSALLRRFHGTPGIAAVVAGSFARVETTWSDDRSRAAQAERDLAAADLLEAKGQKKAASQRRANADRLLVPQGRDAGRWHVHAHLLVSLVGGRIDADVLRDAWRQALHGTTWRRRRPGDVYVRHPRYADEVLARMRRAETSLRPHIEAARTATTVDSRGRQVPNAVHEVAKYLAKPASTACMPQRRVVEMVRALSGYRGATSRGCLRGAWLEEGSPGTVTVGAKDAKRGVLAVVDGREVSSDAVIWGGDDKTREWVRQKMESLYDAHKETRTFRGKRQGGRRQ